MRLPLPPLEPPFDPAIQAPLDRLMKGQPPLRLFTTLARNPRVLQRFLAGGLLDRGSVSLREREIVIDRTTARCGAEYEWGVHVTAFAGAAGLTPAQVDATVLGGPADRAWTAREALLVRLADALCDTGGLDDALVEALGAEFSDVQLLELLALTAQYRMVSLLVTALRLPLEAAAARFPRGG